MTTTAPAPSAGMTAFALQTPWLDQTSWDRTYSNKGQREGLAALTRTCTSPGRQEYFVGSGKVYELEDDIVSPGEDEDRIACLVRLVDVVMSRESHSENTNAEGEEEEDEEEDEEESEKSKEEGEGEEEGEDSNHNYDHNQEVEEGSDKQENDGGFTAWLEDLGEITEEEDDQMEEEAGATRGSPEELVELLFGLTLAIATQPVINGQPQTTILIYFSGILGFSSSPGRGAFVPARSYTSNLSGLVYILRNATAYSHT
ncbi:hypothetical protein H9Q69_007090 [Fusarium xylarioides]|nr:hypothetical protein H9Q69_007090 [Fusarium xylarioides]